MSLLIKIKNTLNNVLEIAGIYCLWILLHYLIANIYAQFCAELSLLGFIKSIFVSQSPHCIAMRWIIYNAGQTINTMWISIAVWITKKLFMK